MNDREHQKILAENITKNGFFINENNSQLLSINLKERIHSALRGEFNLSFDDDRMNVLSKDIANTIIDHSVFTPLQYVNWGFLKENTDSEGLSLVMDQPTPYIKDIVSGEYKVTWKYTVMHGYLYIILKIEDGNSSDVHHTMVSVDLVAKYSTNDFVVRNVKPLYNVFLESHGMSKHVKCDEIIEEEHKLSLRSHPGNGPREYNVAYTSIFGWSVNVL